MNKNIIISAVVVLIIALGVYWWKLSDTKEVSDSGTVTNPIVTSGENPQPGGIHDMPVEPAAAVARKDLAAKLTVDEKSIVIMQIIDTTWSDGCLGLSARGEMCSQALVPGFKVEMLAGGKTYIYRTDKTGATIRPEV